MTEMNQIQFDFAKLQEEKNEKKRTLKLNQNTDAKLNLNIYRETRIGWDGGKMGFTWRNKLKISDSGIQREKIFIQKRTKKKKIEFW